MSREGLEFLGTGWAFPPTFTRGGLDIEMVSGAEDIHQSLRILLTTHQNERPMLDSFGADLNAVMFEEVNAALINRIRSLIYEAIVRYEARIDLLAVDVAAGNDPGELNIRIDYSIRGTNSRFNMVFPFYLNESIAPRT